MAGEINKGITIEFRGNSLSFDKTVDNVNKTIALLQNEAARLNKQLKLDPTNVDLITQRFKTLQQAQQLTVDQLRTYREALYESMDEEKVSKNVEGFDKLKQQIKEAEAKAGELSNQMKMLVDENGNITDVQKWKALRQEQINTNVEINSLTRALVDSVKAADGITNIKKWQDAEKHVGQLGKTIESLEGQMNSVLPKFLEMQETIKGLNNLESGLKGVSKTFDTIASATKGFSTGSLNVLRENAKAAIDFEEAFAGVKKTVNETSTTKYEDLMLAIRQLSKEIPVTTQELAQIGEISGQLGVGADDLIEFTRVIANLGATTNVSGNEAATALARIFNITSKGDFSNVDRFAATLVELGNNAATDERSILELTQRLSSSANMAGFTQPQMLALATAMSSVGLSAEAGGSAISRIMQDITKDVANAANTNGESLKTWAKVAGMTSEEFANAWKNNAAGTLNDIIQGLASARGEGDDVILLLDELGISNIRTIDTMQRLVSAGDLLEEFMVMSNNAWEENVALTNEASKRYETVQSKISILKNTLEDMAYSLGEILLPYIQEVVNKLQEWVNKFTELPEGTRKFIIAITAIGAAISPVARLISNFTGEKGLAGLIGKLKELVGTEGFGGKLASLFGGIGNGGGGLLSGLATGLKGLLAALGPVGIAIGVIVAALIAAYTQSEEVRNKVHEMWETLKDNLLPIIEKLWGWLQQLWELIKVSLTPALDLLVFIGTQLWNVIATIIEWIAKFIGWLYGEDGLMPVLEGLWQLIKWIVETIMVDVIGGAIYGLINGIKSVIGWVQEAYHWFLRLIGVEKQFDGNTVAAKLGSTVRAGGQLIGGPQSVLDSGSLGIQSSTLGRLALASGGGGNTLTLTTSINVTNNGDPIDEATVRRWGNVITDVVSENLGKRW